MKFLKLILIGFLAFSTQAQAADGDTMNFRFNPLGLLAGGLGLNLDIAVNESWTVGPEFSYIDFKIGSGGVFTNEVRVRGIGGAVRGNWHYNGVFTDGFYVGPSLGYSNVEVEASDGVETAKASVGSVYAQALFGYAWYWDSSFNIMLGGGFATILSNPKATVTNNTTGARSEYDVRNTGLALEFSLGFTF